MTPVTRKNIDAALVSCEEGCGVIAMLTQPGKNVAVLMKTSEQNYGFHHMLSIGHGFHSSATFNGDDRKTTILKALRGKREVYLFTSIQSFLVWTGERYKATVKPNSHFTIKMPSEQDMEAIMKKAMDSINEKTAIQEDPQFKPLLSRYAQPKENTTMKFEMVPYLNGQNADLISDEDIVRVIEKVEGDIERLSKIKAQSSKIKDTITALQTDLDALVSYFDTRKSNT